VLYRIPLHVQDDRLLGGLDLAATLATGRPVAQRGLLAQADGGIAVLAMAERIAAGTAARLAAVLDTGEVRIARDGIEQRHPARLGVVALDEGGDEERAPAALCDRLALWLDLSTIAPGRADAALPPRARIAEARARLASVRVDDDLWEAMCEAARRLGISSMRAPLLAVRAARAVAALAGRDRVGRDDAATAARWVLGPRAQALPVACAQDAAGDTAAPRPPATGDAPAESPPTAEDRASDGPPSGAPEAGSLDEPVLDELVLAAATASVPARLLDGLALHRAAGAAAQARGGAGAVRASRQRGAPIGVLRGDPRHGGRLDLLATLRAAAPWQGLRRSGGQAHIAVRADDFRIRRFRQRGSTTVIFAVDASGSTALHRLAEAKGAVELLLADCYSRRDSVAVFAFRGRAAELLLPPTRSLVRARRSLAGLPGGGGTPLASALDATAQLAEAVRRRGDTPLAVLLTDGRANVGRDGRPGREAAEAQALGAARRLRAAGLDALLLDTSPRPNPAARQLADEMGALYLPLPHADAAAVSAAVRGARRAPREGT